MEIIAKYKDHVFRVMISKKLTQNVQSIHYLGEFQGSVKEFINYYSPLYPNARKQVFLDTKRPLLRSVRVKIETMPKFKRLFRKEKLKELLS